MNPCACSDNLLPSSGLKICLNGQRRLRSRRTGGRTCRAATEKSLPDLHSVRALRPSRLFYGAAETDIKVSRTARRELDQGPGGRRSGSDKIILILPATLFIVPAFVLPIPFLTAWLANRRRPLIDDHALPASFLTAAGSWIRSRFPRNPSQAGDGGRKAPGRGRHFAPRSACRRNQALRCAGVGAAGRPWAPPVPGAAGSLDAENDVFRGRAIPVLPRHVRFSHIQGGILD